MRYLNLVVIILFIILNLLSCDNNKSNIYNSYYDNGNIERVVRVYKNDILKIETYYENGIMSGEFNFNKGMFKGVQYIYNEDGKIKEQIICMVGLKFFERTRYYNSGNIMSHNTYYFGKLHGNQFFYDETGKIIKDDLYFNGELWDK